MTATRIDLDAVPRGAKLLGVTLAIVIAAAALLAATSARQDLSPAEALDAHTTAEVIEGRFGEPLVRVSVTNPSEVTTSFLVEWTVESGEAATDSVGHTIIGDVAPGERAEEVVDPPEGVLPGDVVTVASTSGETLQIEPDQIDVVVIDSAVTPTGRLLRVSLNSHREHPASVRVRIGFYDTAGVRYTSANLTLNDVAPMTTTEREVEVLGDHERFAVARAVAEVDNR